MRLICIRMYVGLYGINKSVLVNVYREYIFVRARCSSVVRALFAQGAVGRRIDPS